MTRQFFVGGNWKMNGSISQVQSLVEILNKANVPSNTGKQMKSFLDKKALGRWKYS
jgi:triosephosphate isomerase